MMILYNPLIIFSPNIYGVFTIKKMYKNPIMHTQSDRCAYLKFVLKRCERRGVKCLQYKKLLNRCQNGEDIFNFNDCAIKYVPKVNK